MTAGTATSLGPNASGLTVSTINTLTVGFLAPAFKENVSGYSNQVLNNSDWGKLQYFLQERRKVTKYVFSWV